MYLDKFFLKDINVYLVVILICLFRIFLTYNSPLNLSVDEAQYWLWSQNLQLGFFSKPPLISWIIFISDYFFETSEFSIRFFSTLLHGCTAIILMNISRIVFNQTIGKITLFLWLVIPGVSIGSFIISTDTPLLFFWSISLFCLIKSVSKQTIDYYLYALSGFFLGLAFLSKYAALYFIICLLGWSIFSNILQNREKISAFFSFIIPFIIIISPNIYWNFLNSFITFQHLSGNIGINEHSFSFKNLLNFAISQFAVFGPISFLCLLVFAFKNIYTNNKFLVLLNWFFFPILILLLIQAFVKEANANWAVTAYPSGCILTAYFIDKYKKSKILIISLWSSNIIISLTLSTIIFFGSMGPLTPNSDPLRRLRGWDILYSDVKKIIKDRNLKTLVVSNRAQASLLFYYFRNDSELKNIIDIVIPTNNIFKGNHYERNYPLTINIKYPILALTDFNKNPPRLIKDWDENIGYSKVKISYDKYRKIKFWYSQKLNF